MVGSHPPGEKVKEKTVGDADLKGPPSSRILSGRAVSYDGNRTDAEWGEESGEG
jgi:hypothetical protein